MGFCLATITFFFFEVSQWRISQRKTSTSSTQLPRVWPFPLQISRPLNQSFPRFSFEEDNLFLEPLGAHENINTKVSVAGLVDRGIRDSFSLSCAFEAPRKLLPRKSECDAGSEQRAGSRFGCHQRRIKRKPPATCRPIELDAVGRQAGDKLGRIFHTRIRFSLPRTSGFCSMMHL